MEASKELSKVQDLLKSKQTLLELRLTNLSSGLSYPQYSSYGRSLGGCRESLQAPLQETCRFLHKQLLTITTETEDIWNSRPPDWIEELS